MATLDDSEEDEDYVPPADKSDSDSESGERKAKRSRVSSETPVVEKSDENKQTLLLQRDSLWAEFQASVTSQPGPSKQKELPKMVKVQVTYKFAGEEIKEVKEVSEASEEARKWPKVLDAQPAAETPTPAASAPIDQTSNLPSAQLSSSASPALPTETPPSSAPKKPVGPPPRRPRQSLAALAAGAKPKKISTLEKSRMDWDSHLASTTKDEVDELEKNRRGGGYLEKVDFLQRVDDRKEEALKSTGKRRR